MSFMNESLKLMNIKLQLNNLNIQFDTFLAQLQNNLVINIGASIEEISLKLLNLGLEMLNIEIQSSNIPFFNSTQQIKNIGDMIQNIAMQMANMNSMKMPNFNIGMPFPNILLNNNFSDNIPKMGITFKTTRGKTTNMCLKYGTTIKEMMEKYCKEKGLSINDDHITFINNARKINKNDLTPIESFFINQARPVIVVNDTYDLIGG